MSVNATRDACPLCKVKGWADHDLDCPYFTMYPDKGGAFGALLGDYRHLQGERATERDEHERIVSVLRDDLERAGALTDSALRRAQTAEQRIIELTRGNDSGSGPYIGVWKGVDLNPTPVSR